MTPPVLFDELVMEILSRLPVKSLLRFMCVSKSFESLIYDPSFVKLHRQRSSKSVNFLLENTDDTLDGPFLLPCSVRSLLENPSSLIADSLSPGFDLQNGEHWVVGSCNGLVCLASEFDHNKDKACMFRLWNPATRKTFEDPQCILVRPQSVDKPGFALPHNHYDEYDYSAIITFDELVIVSLDLGNETFTKLLLPRCLDGVHTDDFDSIGDEFHSNKFPRIGVLKACLSLFLQNPKTNHFVIWQMKKLGNRKSWTRLMNIAIQDLQIDCMPRCYLRPLCMFENGRVLTIDGRYSQQFRAIFYDGRDNKVEHSKISSNIRRVHHRFS
ncbi:F-box/kelch-repeat protein [Spatholobus suberectus]|nr:F-box/kelch-repeat protein [Spatholobus suberectus]